MLKPFSDNCYNQAVDLLDYSEPKRIYFSPLCIHFPNYYFGCMQACNRQSAYCVPLYDSLGEDAIEYIIGHASCSVVFVASLKFPGLVEALPRLKHLVNTVVYWGAPDQISTQVCLCIYLSLNVSRTC